MICDICKNEFERGKLWFTFTKGDILKICGECWESKTALNDCLCDIDSNIRIQNNLKRDITKQLKRLKNE